MSRCCHWKGHVGFLDGGTCGWMLVVMTSLLTNGGLWITAGSTCKGCLKDRGNSSWAFPHLQIEENQRSAGTEDFAATPEQTIIACQQLPGCSQWHKWLCFVAWHILGRVKTGNGRGQQLHDLGPFLHCQDNSQGKGMPLGYHPLWNLWAGWQNLSQSAAVSNGHFQVSCSLGFFQYHHHHSEHLEMSV